MQRQKLWPSATASGGKEKMLSLGPFPGVSMAMARAKRDDARKLLLAGTDPSLQRKVDKIAAAQAAENTFALSPPTSREHEE